MFTDFIRELTNTEVLMDSMKIIIGNFSINSAIMIFMMVFCVIGGIDKIRGNKWGYGERFDEAFATMKPLAFVMIGIITLVPILKLILEPVITPIFEFFGASPAMFAGTVLPIDAGAYPLAVELSNGNMAIANFSGIVLGGTLGCVFLGIIPIALSVLREEDYECFAAAVLVSLITIPIGCIVGGLVMNLTPYKISFVEMVINLIPVIIIAVIVAVGLSLWPRQLMHAFNIFGKIMSGTLIIAIVISTVQYVTGLRLPLFYLMVEPAVDGGMSPLIESLLIVGTIAIVLSGAFPMMLWISRTFKKPIQKLSKKLGMDEAGGAALIATLPSFFPALELIKDMNQKTRLLVLAFSVSATFVLGDHLGFVAGIDQNMILPMIISKLVAGITAMILANILAPRLLKENKTSKEIRR